MYVAGYLTFSGYPDAKLKEESSVKVQLTVLCYDAIKRWKICHLCWCYFPFIYYLIVNMCPPCFSAGLVWLHPQACSYR